MNIRHTACSAMDKLSNKSSLHSYIPFYCTKTNKFVLYYVMTTYSIWTIHLTERQTSQKCTTNKFSVETLVMNVPGTGWTFQFPTKVYYTPLIAPKSERNVTLLVNGILFFVYVPILTICNQEKLCHGCQAPTILWDLMQVHPRYFES